jgi:hypothetical protein
LGVGDARDPASEFECRGRRAIEDPRRSNEQISDLQSAYIVAEDLALRQIQQEEQVPLLRHVNIGDVPFDAVLVKQDVIYCAEVSFLVAPDLRQERIESMLRKMARVKTVVDQMGVEMRVMLMIILVTQLTQEDEQRLRRTLNTAKRFPGSPVEIEIRFLDFEALQRILCDGVVLSPAFRRPLEMNPKVETFTKAA